MKELLSPVFLCLYIYMCVCVGGNISKPANFNVYGRY